ncbi:MAG: helix-turn-helix domain-containing protein [Hyphomicrobiaceae bacterium]
MLGAFYGYRLGSESHAVLGALFAAAALGGALLTPLATDEAIRAAQRGAVLTTMACAAFAAVSVTYSTAAALSLSAGIRGDHTASRSIAGERATLARAVVARASAELDTLAPSRPSGELQAIIGRLMQTSGANGCERTTGAAPRKVCTEVATLKAELARSDRRAELEARIADATRRLGVVPPVGAADPLASAVAVYANSLGMRWEPAHVAPWLLLVPVLFLELGAALSLFVARAACALPDPGDAAQRLPEARQTPSGGEDAGAPPADTPSSGIQTGATVRMLNRIRREGGAIEGSTRELARALEIGKSTVHRAIGALAAQGLVTVEASRAGTRIALA